MLEIISNFLGELYKWFNDNFFSIGDGIVHGIKVVGFIMIDVLEFMISIIRWVLERI